MKYVINALHATMLCYVIGAYATENTTLVLFGIDFVLNIFNCLRFVFVYQRKRSHGDKDVQIELILDLALCETVEFHVPFILVLSISFLDLTVISTETF